MYSILIRNIDELYLLAAHAKRRQDYNLPYFPVRSMCREGEVLDNLTKDDLHETICRPDGRSFDYFEKFKQLLLS